MNTVQLECFIAVARHLNFSRASEALKISQPAVSHQIRTLEEELNVRLFLRTSKNVSLTQEGIRFLPDAQLILNTAASARERLKSSENYLPFDIGCYNHSELELLPPVIRKLADEFPLLRPSVRLVPFPSLFGLVENQKLHCAFQIKDPSRKTGLRFRELCRAPIACVCAPGHPLSQYPSLTADMLEGRIIACSPQQIPQQLFRIQSRIVASLPPEQHYFTEGLESVLTLVKAGLGYTLYLDLSPVREPGLCYIPVTDLPPVSFGICHRYENDHPALNRFLFFCREQFHPANKEK